MSIIWPNMFNPEPDDDEHFPECDAYRGMQRMRGEDEFCICGEIVDERKADAAEEKFDYMRENL